MQSSWRAACFTPLARARPWAVVLLGLVSACYQVSAASHERDAGVAPEDADQDASSPRDDAPHTQPSDAGDGDAQSPAPTAIRHAACTAPVPAQPPFAPGQFSEPPEAGVEDDCAGAAELITCSKTLPCPFDGQCLMPELGGEGFCVLERDCNAALGGRGEPLPYGAGTCMACVEPAFKKAACCAGAEGVDCRALPLVEGPRGTPGSLCSLHEDCEAGLLCSAPPDFRWGFAHGRCLCPGVSARDVHDRPDCSAASAPARWASTLGPPLPAACVPGIEAGWVVERFGRHAGDRPMTVAARPDGGLNLVLHEAGALKLLTRSTAGWQSESVPDFSDARDLALFVADTGDVHLAQEAPFRSQLRHAVRRHGVPGASAWSSELVGEAEGARQPRLFVEPSGTVHLAYYEQFSSRLRYRRREGELFGAALSLSPDPPQSGLALVSVGGRVELVYDTGLTIMRAQLVDGVLETTSVATGQGMQAAAAGDTLAVLHHDHAVDDISLTLLDGTEPHQERVWIQDNLRYRSEASVSSLAMSASGTVHVAHTAPEGVLLQTRNDDRWSSTWIAKHASLPTLVLDAQGEPHVFFAVSSEARHAFRGSCP